ncbi:MAG: hypothetical protein UFJ18_06770 [Blautia sp.]|nr:hypothetical protein [Blautia sp.]
MIHVDAMEKRIEGSHRTIGQELAAVVKTVLYYFKGTGMTEEQARAEIKDAVAVGLLTRNQIRKLEEQFAAEKDEVFKMLLEGGNEHV